MSEQPKTGKINRTPAEPSLHLPLEDLTWLRQAWLDSRRVADVTRVSYETKTRPFVTWWAEYGESVDWHLSKRNLGLFETWLGQQKASFTGAILSFTTRRHALQRLREMFGWAHATGIIETVDPRLWVPGAEGTPAERTAATPEQLTALMVAALSSPHPLRDQAILAFFIGTGCRLCEVAGLKGADLRLMEDDSGTANVTGKRTSANKSGKRAVAFDATTGKYLVKYLDDYVIGPAEPLWINDEGLPLSKTAIYKVTKRAIKTAGLENEIQACHDLRRAFATILGMMHPDSPGWADMIRRQLGHKNYAMTARYTLIGAADFREKIVTPLAEGK